MHGPLLPVSMFVVTSTCGHIANVGTLRVPTSVIFCQELWDISVTIWTGCSALQGRGLLWTISVPPSLERLMARLSTMRFVNLSVLMIQVIPMLWVKRGVKGWGTSDGHGTARCLDHARFILDCIQACLREFKRQSANSLVDELSPRIFRHESGNAPTIPTHIQGPRNLPIGPCYREADNERACKAIVDTLLNVTAFLSCCRMVLSRLDVSLTHGRCSTAAHLSIVLLWA